MEKLQYQAISFTTVTLLESNQHGIHNIIVHGIQGFLIQIHLQNLSVLKQYFLTNHFLINRYACAKILNVKRNVGIS